MSRAREEFERRLLRVAGDFCGGFDGIDWGFRVRVATGRKKSFIKSWRSRASLTETIFMDFIIIWGIFMTFGQIFIFFSKSLILANFLWIVYLPRA